MKLSVDYERGKMLISGVSYRKGAAGVKRKAAERREHDSGEEARVLMRALPFTQGVTVDEFIAKGKDSRTMRNGVEGMNIIHITIKSWMQVWAPLIQHVNQDNTHSNDRFHHSPMFSYVFTYINVYTYMNLAVHAEALSTSGL
jgi:hypothetical protein